MDDNREKYEGEVKVRLPFSKRFENFWYHYKWHTIVSAAVIFILTILTLQMCNRTSFDVHIMYAGDYEIKKTSSGGDRAPYVKVLQELESVAGDFDSDGEVNVNFLNLFVVNEEEADRLVKENPDAEINETLVREDTATFTHDIIYGDYYLCFLSERIFLEYEKNYGERLFSSLEGYAEGAEGCEFASETKHGIYLSSLDFYTLPEISKLPDDTVIVLKKISEVSGAINKKDSEKKFKMGESMLENILAY